MAIYVEFHSGNNKMNYYYILINHPRHILIITIIVTRGNPFSRDYSNVWCVRITARMTTND